MVQLIPCRSSWLKIVPLAGTGKEASGRAFPKPSPMSSVIPADVPAMRKRRLGSV